MIKSSDLSKLYKKLTNPVKKDTEMTDIGGINCNKKVGLEVYKAITFIGTPHLNIAIYAVIKKCR